MTIEQVREYFMDKEESPCPLTEKLVKAGYQQSSGGYIARAINEGIEVNYKQNKPSQYWHLMSYCNSREPKATFGKSIVCGELIFWMAEVSESVDKKDLLHLVERIIKDGILNEKCKIIFDRKKWNKEIQNLCFDSIKSLIDKSLL